MNNYISAGLGIAAVILAVLLGVGGCLYLLLLGQAKINESNRVVITNSFNSIKLNP